MFKRKINPVIILGGKLERLEFIVFYLLLAILFPNQTKPHQIHQNQTKSERYPVTFKISPQMRWKRGLFKYNYNLIINNK